MDCLLSNKLISKQQHGFLSGRSTSAQLLESMNDWSIAVNSGQCIYVCYIDFKSAFDIVSHIKLLNKLSSYGLSGNMWLWLSAFLSNHQQSVIVNGVLSDPVMVSSSIPEGSVLGLLLFLLYINDVVDCFTFSSCKLFANDLKIYYAFNHMDICDNALQFDLNALEIWAAKLQLTISIQKSFILHIGLKNQNIKYYFCGSEIASKDIICDLGVHVSNDLFFNDHIYIICKKAYWVINNFFDFVVVKTPM